MKAPTLDEWDSSLLWNKARLFMRRALAESREGPLFPFWATLSLELLARSTIANVHPALLADPREPDNVLAVFGFRTSDKPPTSIPAKALFSRCAAVVPEFTSEDATFCTRLAALRNEELHAGTSAFAGYPTGQWMGDFYRVARILLEAIEQDLVAFLSDEGEAAAAAELVTATQARIEKAVKDSVAEHRRAWEALDDAERAARRALPPRTRAAAYWKRTECPACGSASTLTGDTVSISEPRVVEDGIVRDVVIQPTQLTCVACDLSLTGVPSLYAASHELAGQFSNVTFESPEDFYGIEVAATPDYDY